MKLSNHKSLSHILISLFTVYLPALLAGCLLVAVYSPVLAQNWETFGAGDDSNPGAATFKSLEAVFSNVLTIVFALAGLVSFIMLLVGGFTFLFSGGNPEKTKKAWGTITWAIFGLVFLIGAWFIMRFIKEFTGADVTHFEIPS